MRPRPEPGTAFISEIKVKICGKCGYMVVNTLCDYNCSYDGALSDNRPIITAVYQRTDVFLRDE